MTATGAENIAFVNPYEAKGDITFKGTKELTGRALKEGEFTFELYDGEGNLIESVKNDADGKFSFTALEYIHNATKSDLGEHKYIVKEKKESLSGVTYDETEYAITVTVADNGDGTLSVTATGADAIAFVNPYEAKGDITFKGTKELTGRKLEAGEFTFELYDENGTLLESVQNDADGKFSFKALEYIHNATQSDLGEHKYIVKEKKESLGGVTWAA